MTGRPSGLWSGKAGRVNETESSGSGISHAEGRQNFGVSVMDVPRRWTNILVKPLLLLFWGFVVYFVGLLCVAGFGLCDLATCGYRQWSIFHWFQHVRCALTVVAVTVNYYYYYHQHLFYDYIVLYHCCFVIGWTVIEMICWRFLLFYCVIYYLLCSCVAIGTLMCTAL